MKLVSCIMMQNDGPILFYDNQVNTDLKCYETFVLCRLYSQAISFNLLRIIHLIF